MAEEPFELKQIVFFNKKLSFGIGPIAALIYPDCGILRLSDFNVNRNINATGEGQFEPNEQNHTKWWRGVSRYNSKEDEVIGQMSFSRTSDSLLFFYLYDHQDFAAKSPIGYPIQKAKQNMLKVAIRG